MAASEPKKVPYVLDLSALGVIEGLSYISQTPTTPSDNYPYPKNLRPRVLCHYFGGIPYALPPVGPYRFKKPRALPSCYRYGTHSNPGRFNGGTGVCPQPTVEENVWEEDCLQVNIWIPGGQPPKGGWPVFIYIHGGFLQFGTANGGDLSALLSETNFGAIIVKPAYRLNLFGFLASEELLAESPNAPDFNVGFWDQRLALEWTYKNISYFGGNAGNITVAGYSAGSHSTFQQLQYDLYLPTDKSIIRRAVMWSNGPGVQPHTLIERQEQFNELLTKLSIPLSLTATEKMARLRALPMKALVDANNSMALHEFRAVTDNAFISSHLFTSICSGDFAQRMRDRGVEIITGECRDEHFVYESWRTPDARTQSYRKTFDRLQGDYPLSVVRVIMQHYSPDGKLPKGCKDWNDAFGRIYADTQIHNMERGFVDCLDKFGAGDLVHRYRVEWRAQCADTSWPREWGVTHGTDIVLWLWGEGRGEGLTEKEKGLVKTWMHDAFCDFVHGKDIRTKWGTHGPQEVRRIKPSGETDIWKDKEMWENGLEVWHKLKEAGCLGETQAKAKL
ncbi:carboxylesterase-lipase family protein [Rhizodiscina lignyota]|uniref:Carboxylic ester hydrolase n=1 Tax=Rhizodiscina lignyota TaxID=1504668 RepID=A0A9P4IE51_9PEZI|nr:carboxylesterase-lipase family protein [Rhizodiscina lignyota]